MSILVFHNGSNGVHIHTIRAFPDEQEKKARKYYESLSGGASWHRVYGYKTSEEAEPKIIWSNSKDKKGSK